MKAAHSLTVILAGIFLSVGAQARVPLAQMEKLRRQSVVVRVILDNPESKEAKQCQFGKEYAELGAQLALNMDNASAAWKNEKITESDLAVLIAKTKICAARGSCQVYERFLESASVEPALQSQVDELKKNLEGVLSRLEAKDYRQAWQSVANPCAVF